MEQEQNLLAYQNDEIFAYVVTLYRWMVNAPARKKEGSLRI